MNTIQHTEATPEYTRQELEALLHTRDLGLKVLAGGVLTGRDQEVGNLKMVPYSKLGTPMSQVTSQDEKFLTRVSIHHRERTTPGIPNLWLSTYEVPDASLVIEFFRTGTPVPAVTKSARAGIPKLPDYDVVVNPELARDNVSAIRKLMQGYRADSSHAKLLTPTAGEELFSIDLQSPKGGRAESGIVTTQKEASVGLVRYINVPVHTMNYGTLERWILPQDTVTEVTALLASVRGNIIKGTAYTHAVHELLGETERLLKTQAVGGGTPPERYALAARIGLVVLLSGQKLQVNCRSGKDRTGLFDAEIKFAAYQLWRRSQGLAVSAPGAEVLPSEKRAWELLLLRSGNREVQLVNAGVPGNKVASHHMTGRVGKSLWTDYVGEAEAALD